MNRMLKFLVIGAVAALMSIPAMAQTQEASTLSVSAPLQVGDQILQPGIYTLRLLPTFKDRTRVQFRSVDNDKINASVLTVPHSLTPKKEETHDHPTFVFYNDAAGVPIALRTWYPSTASDLGGHDIVYEEARARQLARLSKSRVVTYTTTETADLDRAPLSVITPEEKIEPYVYTAPPPPPVMVSSAPAPIETPAMTTPEPAPAQTTEATETVTTHKKMRKD